ncbi:MAG: UDP-N-acetylmuramoyl-L-alanyl-D-glutamate--2,6-diaminopimelate ligase [Anaerolineaceae bacterium]|nr:UDP-N-acetylmuramoyl-L-alanyl-D-glutamate--2,6-diaminopimelate ligase [Anaerolineaceae bacterium]
MIGFIKKSLRQIFSEIPVRLLNQTELTNDLVAGVVVDSRLVQPGFIFAASIGQSSDGHQFIPDAIARGALAVIGTQMITGLPVTYLHVEDARYAMAHVAASLYDYPARQMTVIGVTGTDGKTTTSNLIYQILTAAGHWSGIISSVNAMIGDEVLDTGFHVTTPEATDIQRYLARMVAAGLTHVVLESTSHGLAQNRVTGCEFDIGVITNITHEHLDYHGSYENYRAAKARLFTELANTQPKAGGNPRLAVLNRDDDSYDYLNGLVTTPKVSYSICADRTADIIALRIKHEVGCMHFDVVGKDFETPVICCLPGNYNISNSLAAFAATVIGLGVSPETAARGIHAMRAIPGRMERIDIGQDFIALVDFAHTPNALKHALQTARQMASGKVLAVFGSAGLRDREKRRMMAEISIDLADITVLTAEDPRTESLEEILDEMAEAAKARGGREGIDFWRVNDRGDAIRHAVQLAREGDVVVCCGKGHEQSMCFGEVEYPWDERNALRAALAEHLGVDGPKMPYLPTQSGS